jgi:hypothetical protein
VVSDVHACLDGYLQGPLDKPLGADVPYKGVMGDIARLAKIGNETLDICQQSQNDILINHALWFLSSLAGNAVDQGSA